MGLSAIFLKVETLDARGKGHGCGGFRVCEQNCTIILRNEIESLAEVQSGENLTVWRTNYCCLSAIGDGPRREASPQRRGERRESTKVARDQ